MKTKVNRSGLFWRILITLIASLFIFGLLTALVSKHIFERSSGLHEYRHKLEAISEQIHQHVRSNGVEQLKPFVSELALNEGIELLILDQDNQPLTSDFIPRGIHRQMRHGFFNPWLAPVKIDIADNRHIKVIGLSGHMARFSHQLARVPWWQRGMVPLAGFILVLMSVSYVVAHMLAKPLIKLQAITDKAADGDYAVRVPACLLERKDEVGLVARSFNNMLDKVESTLESQKRLLRDISHEIRTPLARQRLALELLSDTENPEKYIKKIVGENEKVEQMVNEIMTFTKIADNSEAYPLEAIAPNEVISLVIQENSEEATKKSVQLLGDALGGKIIISGNALLLKRAFENVIRNAIVYTRENSVVRIGCQQVEGMVEYRITDQGNGVDEAQLTSLFSPFFRADEDRNSRTGGFGLGLAIASHAICFHAGDIWAENVPVEKGGGLAVVIRLPLATFAG